MWPIIQTFTNKVHRYVMLPVGSIFKSAVLWIKCMFLNEIVPSIMIETRHVWDIYEVFVDLSWVVEVRSTVWPRSCWLTQTVWTVLKMWFQYWTMLVSNWKKPVMIVLKTTQWNYGYLLCAWSKVMFLWFFHNNWMVWTRLLQMQGFFKDMNAICKVLNIG